LIYLDNAATTKPYQEVVNLIYEDLKNSWGNASTVYSIGLESKKIIEDSRERIAACMGADPEEIYFTSGSSEGNAWAINQKSRCICSPYEHHNITNNNKSVIIDTDYLKMAAFTMKQNRTAIPDLYKDFLLSWMMVNNESGEIFDTEFYGKIAKELGMAYHCDMTQAIGNVYINLHEDFDYVDIATASAHKFGGPKGIGFAYFNKNTFPNEQIKPLIYGGGQEMNVRAGTENIPYIHAMALALEITLEHAIKKYYHCKKLKLLFLEQLMKNFDHDDYYIISPTNSIMSTFSVAFKGVESEILTALMDDVGICINTGSACNDGSMETSSVLKSMNVPEEYIRGPVRISTSLETTENEIIETVNFLKNFYKDLTSIK